METKIRILRIIASMDPRKGGPCQGIRNSIPALAKLGIVNEVVSFDSPDVSFSVQDNFVIHALGPGRGPFVYCPALRIWLEKNFTRFDIVIIHGLWLYNCYGTYRSWQDFKKTSKSAPKLYIMPHGMLDPYFQVAKDRLFKSIRNWFFWNLVQGKIVNQVNGLLFTCEQELLLARTTFNHYHPKQEINVGYGIEAPPGYKITMKEAFMQKCSILATDSYWLFLSRIHQKKGVDLLVKGYLKLKRAGNRLPKLVIAGPGIETPYGMDVLNLASNDPDIFFPGMLTGESKWGAIYNSEMFILPSHQENYGISVVEALACATPVLITDQVNIWPEILKGKAGLVFSNTEIDTFNILKLWFELDSEQKAIMSDNARLVYQNNFTNETAALHMAAALDLDRND